MLLSRALRVGPGSIVAFVGGGGKTSAMFRLARELAERIPVITTTTTRIFAAQTSLAPVHISAGSPDELPDFVELFSAQPHVLITGPPELSGSGKAPGITLDTFSALLGRTAGLSPAILIEADGSRMRPFKAPGPREPVIPPQTTHLVPVVGADILGRPLRDEYVHRAELVAELSGAPLGSQITSHLIASVMAHQEGGLKGKPAGARASLLINKVESSEMRQAGLEVIQQILVDEGYQSGLLSSLKSSEPVQEVIGRTAGVVLAAGESSRFSHGPKQLVEFRGKPLAAHAVDAALGAGLTEVILVVGSAGDRVRAALGSRPVQIVENPRWGEGQSSSLRVGLQAVPGDVDAVIFLLGDQPFVTSDLLRALIEAHRKTMAPIVAPRHQGRRGNPDLFDRATWPDLLTLSGDVGGREVIEKYLEEVAWVEWDESIHADVDTFEDFERLVNSE